MTEKQGLEQNIESVYRKSLPEEARDFFDALPNEVQSEFRIFDLYNSAISALEDNDPVKKAVEYTGVLLAAKLLDKTEKRNSISYKIMEDIFIEYAKKAGFDEDKIRKYLGGNENGKKSWK